MHKSIWALLFHALLISYIGILIVKPVLRNISLTPPGTTYSFTHRIVEDYYFYLMVIRQGRDSLREYDQYTTEQTEPTSMHLYYLLLGTIGKMTGLSDTVMYYVGALAGLAVFYIFSWKLASLLFPNFYKYAAMVLIIASSPFPDTKITLFGQQIPVGTSWWTNMNPYSRLTQVPHHFIGQGLMIAAVYFSLLFFMKRKFPWALAASVVTVMGIFFYSVPILTFLLAGGLTLALYVTKPMTAAAKHKALLAYLKKQEKFIIGIGLIAATAVVAVFFVQLIIAGSGWPWSTFLAWEANWYNHKTEIYPYTIGVYLVSFGLLPLAVLPALVSIVRRPKPMWVFIAMLVFCPILLYLGAAKHLYLLPKIRFIHTAPYVFAGLLATYGIQSVLTFIQGKAIKTAAAALLASGFLISSVLGLQSYWWPEMTKYEMFYNTYIPNEYYRVIDYLNRTSSPFSNVFASYAIGVYLPSYTKNKVYVGHMVSTSDFWAKYSTANSFFKHELSEKDALAVFKANNIAYVLGEEPGLTDAYKNILRPVYTDNNLTLYIPVYEDN